MSLSSRKLVARPVWWNQSGNSEAAKMKSAWFEASQEARCPCRCCELLALAVVLKTALS